MATNILNVKGDIQLPEGNDIKIGNYKLKEWLDNINGGIFYPELAPGSGLKHSSFTITGVRETYNAGASYKQLIYDVSPISILMSLITNIGEGVPKVKINELAYGFHIIDSLDDIKDDENAIYFLQ